MRLRAETSDSMDLGLTLANVSKQDRLDYLQVARRVEAPRPRPPPG